MKLLLTHVLAFIIGISIGLYLVDSEVKESEKEMRALVDTQARFDKLLIKVPPARRVPMEAIELEDAEASSTATVIESSNQIGGESNNSQTEGLLTSNNGTLRAALAKHPNKKIINIEGLLDAARVLEQELKASQAVAYPLFERAQEQRDEKTKKQLLERYRRRRSQAWSDYQTRIEQLVTQHLED